MEGKESPTQFKMENKRINILCTRPVDKSLVDDAVRKGFNVNTLEFIKTVAIKNHSLQQQVQLLGSKPCIAVFTSMNAVDSVIDLLQGIKPSWKIFCMGNTTRQLVVKYFGIDSLVATAVNATDLANTIVDYRQSIVDNSECIFFCGDQRRDELPDVLKANHIAITEITVYKTNEISQVINKHYDAILFFSPSAVHSYFKNNQAQSSTIIYAIGGTTANAARSYCDNKIVISETPSKDDLFRLCIKKFTG